MASLRIAVTTPGQTLYVVRINLDDGTFWNGSAWEVYNAAHWNNYSVVMTEKAGSGIYTAPAIDMPFGVYLDMFFIAIGSSPALGDTPADIHYANTGFDASIGTIVSGKAVAGTLSTSQMTSTLTGGVNNAYNGRIIIWTSGVLKGQATNITGYNGTTGLFTFTPVTNAPAAADTFIIV